MGGLRLTLSNLKPETLDMERFPVFGPRSHPLHPGFPAQG